MDSAEDRRHSSPGFPHSGIPGSRPACGSPRLIAASYALRRLLMPGHPPYTLSSLTKHLLLTHMVFSRPIQLSKNDRRGRPRLNQKERTACWWSWAELNRRPSACKADALPTELQPHSCTRSRSGWCRRRDSHARNTQMVGLGRIELPTSRLSGVRSSHLSYRPSRSSQPARGDDVRSYLVHRRARSTISPPGLRVGMLRCTEVATLGSGFLKEWYSLERR